MPNSDAEFEKLIGEWRAGSADALAKLLNKHAGRVREAVRARLNDRLRAEYDSLDFVQDVWASLLAISSDRNDFESSDQFIGFLVRVAEFKVIEVTRRRFKTKKRDIRREEPLPINPDKCAVALRSREPSPSQKAIGEERWEQLVSRLSEGHKKILQLLRDGSTHEQIAEHVGLSVRTVERVVRQLKDQCGL